MQKNTDIHISPVSMDDLQTKYLSQSNKFTFARYDFSVFEKRILYRVVELIQADLSGEKIGNGITLQKGLFNECWIHMPLSAFKSKGEVNQNDYDKIKNAFKKLHRKFVEIKTDKFWKEFTLVIEPKIDKYTGEVSFKIAGDFYNILLDFSKGYSQYDMVVAFNFRSTFTMRIYEIISVNKTNKLTFNIENLKHILGLENKYQKITDFIKRIIEPTKQDLIQANSPYQFDYEVVKFGRSAKNINFYINYIPSFDKSIAKQVSTNLAIGKDFLNILKENLGGEANNYKPHNELLQKVKRMLPPGNIENIIHKAKQVENPIGYAIASFKKAIKELEFIKTE